MSGHRQKRIGQSKGKNKNSALEPVLDVSVFQFVETDPHFGLLTRAIHFLDKGDAGQLSKFDLRSLRGSENLRPAIQQ